MAAKTYRLLLVEEDSGDLVMPSPHSDQVLVLDKEKHVGNTLYQEDHWHDGYPYNKKAQLIPIGVECSCGEDAELWWLRGCYYSQHFVVCDCECNQAIQLEGCDG